MYEYQPWFEHLRKIPSASSAGSGSDCNRRLAQKLLYIGIRAGGDSALGKIAATTTTASYRGKNLLEQRPHVGRCRYRVLGCRFGRGLRKDQTRRIKRARHQRCGRHSSSRNFLGVEFSETHVAIGKGSHNDFSSIRLRLRLKIGGGHQPGKFVERLVFLFTEQLALIDALANLLRHIPELSREKPCCFSERAVVAPRHPNRPLPADKLHAGPLPHLFGFAKNNRSNLSAGGHVRSSAGRKIEIRYLDQSQFIALCRRKLAQAKLFSLRTRNVANTNRPVLKNNLIRPLFRFNDLVCSDRRRG